MKHINLVLMAVVVFFTLTAEKCGHQSAQDQGEATQERVINKARKDVKVPDIQNFRAREAVKEQVQRLDDPSKNWYIYVLSDAGNPIGYYVAQTKPLPVGTYLTPPKRVHEDADGDVVIPAPSLDGTYYGSGGGAGQQYFFFTRGSNAYMEIKGLNYFASDQPIVSIDAPRFRVEQDSKKNK